MTVEMRPGATPSVCDVADEPVFPEAIARTLEAIGGKWKIAVLWHLWRRPYRFNELRRALPGVTQHVLTATLRELVRDGIVTRTAYAEMPLRVEYALTERGGDLGPVFLALRRWGDASASA